MSRWLSFFAQRFPFPALFLISFGLAWGSRALFGQSWDTKEALVSGLYSLIFFAVLRLMDEVKDFKKDLIAHPERPLPQGLLTLAEARQGILVGTGLMAFLALPLGIFSHPTVVILWLWTCLHLWLMYKEFYLGEWLEKKPLLYALSHQAILLPLAGFTGLICFADSASSIVPWWKPGLPLLGAFFTYEVCRKLDPEAHPILQTYRSTLGLRGSFLLVCASSAGAMFGLWLNHTVLWQASFIGLSFAAGLTPLVFVCMAQNKHKFVELFATLLLLANFWIPALQLWLKK